MIEKHDLGGFIEYLGKTGNTICGRNPIILALSLIQASKCPLETKLIHYSQSEPVKSPKASSVSYASLVSFIR